MNLSTNSHLRGQKKAVVVERVSKQESMYGLSAKKRGHCREEAAVERGPLWRGGRCREVAIVERGPL